MYHQSSGLVNHQNLIIFVDDIQRDIFCLPVAFGRQLGLQLQRFTADQLIAATAHFAVHQQLAIFDPLLQARTGIIGKEFGGNLVEATVAHVEGNFCAVCNLSVHKGSGML